MYLAGRTSPRACRHHSRDHGAPGTAMGTDHTHVCVLTFPVDKQAPSLRILSSDLLLLRRLTLLISLWVGPWPARWMHVVAAVKSQLLRMKGKQMTRAFRVSKVVSLFALLLGLMVFGSTAAQAEPGAHWNVNGSAVSGTLLPEIQASLVNSHGIL